ncbi:MAG TPA: C25 family cysteine peptidase [Anaerolineales bacterium]|nr:C25 family cysteine peptidase [Anaerolineales bacterium]
MPNVSINSANIGKQFDKFAQRIRENCADFLLKTSAMLDFAGYRPRKIVGLPLLMVSLSLLACQLGGVQIGLPAQGSKTPSDAKRVKLTVNQPGFYKVPLSEIAATGIQLPDNALESFRLTHRNQPLSVWRDEANIYFYAGVEENLYSPQQIYWLEMDSAVGWQDVTCGVVNLKESEIQESEAQPNEPLPISAGEGKTVAIREFFPHTHYAAKAPLGKNWVGVRMLSGSKTDYPMQFVGDPASESALWVEVWSDTHESSLDPDHHLQVLVNGQMVYEENWDGAGSHLLKAKIPAGIWHEGENTVTLSLPPTESAVERHQLYKMTLFSVSSLQAVDNQLAFWGNGTQQNVGNFTQPAAIFDISQANAPQCVTGTGDSAAVSLTSQSDAAYLAVVPTSARMPDAIELPSRSVDLAGLKGADYLAIGPADLLKAAEPLFAQRRSQGLSVEPILLSDVYDQFGAGYAEPTAIQAFIRYAKTEWSIAPRFVLLLGDASYDSFGYKSDAKFNILPIFYVTSEEGGITGSDIPYVDVDGDYLPDLAVGRIPARTAEQVSILVQKTLDFETQSTPELMASILTVADPGESEREQFVSAANGFAANFPSDQFQQAQVAPLETDTNAGEQVLAQWGQGHGLIAYFGHGAPQQWGKSNLLTTELVANSPTDFSPVVVQFTCLTGIFIHPETETLAEVMLWQKNGGATAMLAPTSPTVPTSQHILANALALEWVNAQQTTTFGELLLAAQRQVPTASVAELEVLQTYLLLGDPALPIKLK